MARNNIIVITPQSFLGAEGDEAVAVPHSLLFPPINVVRKVRKISNKLLLGYLLRCS